MTITIDTYFVAVSGAADCIAARLEAESPLGRPGRVLLAPGVEIAWDGCDCGQLAIAFTHGPFPSPIFPTEQIIDQQHCGDAEAVQLTVSLTRCQYHPAPTGSGGTTPPTPTAQTQAVRYQMADEFIIRSALFCCLQDMLDNGTIDDYRIGASDYSSSGACGEVRIVFYIQVI